VIAGRADLLARLYHDLPEIDVVVDVEKVPELNVLLFDSKDGLTIGAAVPWCRVCEDQEVNVHYPCLAMVARLTRSLPVEEWVTVGGNLCAKPASSDALPALIAMEATCNIAGPEGQRTLPAEKLWAISGRTTLEPGELLVSIHLPAPCPHSGAWYIPFDPGDGRDIVFVRVAASLTLDEGNSMILAARVALGAVASAPLLLDTVSAVLVGQPPSEMVLNTAAALARVAVWPTSETDDDAARRAQAAGFLTRRALKFALTQAKREIQ
jgi:carbon-monoxide dehydrogenase medium subunit